MSSVEEEYKMTKIKSTIKLYSNEDSTMRLVREFEKNAVHQDYQSLVKEARMFAEELGFSLDLSFRHPKCRDNTDGADVPRDKICLLYTSPSPRDLSTSRMPSSA